MANVKLGTKVRAMRRREGLTQVQLAEKLGISASYLNLIEHEQRALTAPLLVRVAQVFRADLNAFVEDGEVRVAQDLQEIFGDPLFDEIPLTTNDVRDAAGNANVSRALLRLYRSYQSLLESTRALASKVYDGREFEGIDPAHLPSEEVSDVIQQNMNYFPELEQAAEELAESIQLDRTDFFRQMSLFLRERHGIDTVILPAQATGAVRRFDPQTKRLAISESLSHPSRNFQLAHQIGLITTAAVLDGIIGRSHLTTPESVRLCRIALANYFAGALLMPYESFIRTAEDLRYDIELLGVRFGASFEQVCHRLTTLRRQGRSGVSFHFLRVDVAGNISKRFSGTGIRFARFSGSCPRWDVHAAFLTPERIRTQVSIMPDGTRYFCVARTIQKSFGGYHAPQTLMAVGLGCSVREARQLVYADGVDLDNVAASIPIGTTCRLCERMDCEQRAFPPLQHGLSVDENVRGISFYAPARAAGTPPIDLKVKRKARE
jgi:predicted transcriptional regulator/DNA-binding XRE family transcriptional regulator